MFAGEPPSVLTLIVMFFVSSFLLVNQNWVEGGIFFIVFLVFLGFYFKNKNGG